MEPNIACQADVGLKSVVSRYFGFCGDYITGQGKKDKLTAAAKAQIAEGWL